MTIIIRLPEIFLTLNDKNNALISNSQEIVILKL